MLKKVFEVNFFFSNILVPGIVLILYCGSFAFLSRQFLLEGVNYFFVNRLGKYLLFVLAGAVLILIALLWSKPGSKLDFGQISSKFFPGDLILLLLPLTPVVQYILSNREILSPASSLYILLFFVFFLGFYIFAIPALLGFVMPTRTLMLVGLAFMSTLISMASLSDTFTWFESGSLKIQLLFLGGVFFIVWLLYHLNRRALYLFVLIVFIANTAAQLLSKGSGSEVASSGMEKNRLLSSVAGKTPVTKPDIYLLIYDAYVPNETMLSYGIDNSAQENHLMDQGFTLYPHTYSIGSTTLGTMSRVLNASTEFYGNKRRAVSGDGVAQKILKSIGYDTYGVFYSDYMFRGVGETYDFSYPEKSVAPYVQLVKAILIGEFRFNIEGEGFGEVPREQFLAAKRNIFKHPPGKPIFVYMHTNLPTHSQNSGACRSDEVRRYQDRLAQANLEMRQDVDLIVEKDPDAIVIVAGDHGPYLTKNCDSTTRTYDISEITRQDIQDRHATFLAIRWPGRDFVRYDDITVLQDLFPAVFAYLYQDPTILESKIKPVIPTSSSTTSGASVDHGMISGGIDDGKPLFLSGK